MSNTPELVKAICGTSPAYKRAMSRKDARNSPARSADGVIWDQREIKLFGFVLWRRVTRRMTTTEMMRRAGIE